MRTRFVSIILVAGLALAACGGSDSGGGSPQDEVADMMIDALNEEMEGEDMAGVTIDEDCIRDSSQDLSDDDAQKILDAGPDGDPVVSDDADAVAEALLECITFDFSELDVDSDG